MSGIYIVLIILGFTYVILDNLGRSWNNKSNFTHRETFNDQNGQFCLECSNKNFNQCTNCFNCSWCSDKHGDGKCIPGDVNGSYNAEKCYSYYNGDPWNRMKQDNQKQTCNLDPNY